MESIFKRMLSARFNSITSAAIVIAVAGLFSRILGIIRDRVLAGQFGAGTELDIYYAAFRVPDLVYNLIVLGALSAGFIPVFVKLLRNEEGKNYEDNAKAWDFVNNTINILAIFLIVIGAVLAIFSRPLVAAITPGFSGEKLEWTITLTRIMFLSPVLLGLSGIVGSVLQSCRRFLVFSLAPVMYNIGIIFGALFLVKPFGLLGLAYGVILGALLHLIIQLPTLDKLGYGYKAIFNFKDSDFIQMIKLTGPRILGLASAQLNLIITTLLASLIATGSLAIFNLANNLQSFPLGLFGVSFAIAAFPALSKFFADGKDVEFREAFLKTFKQIMFFVIPFSVLFIILRIQIVRVVLGAGKFDWGDTITTADALGVFCLSLFAQALLPLLARAFYARHNTMIPFVASLTSVAVNLVVSWYAIRSLGVLGLALGFAISSIVNFILLAVLLKFKIRDIYRDDLLRTLFKISLATLIMGVLTQYIKTGLGLIVDMNKFWGVFIQGVVAGIIGLLIFGIIAYLLKSEELLMFLASVKRRLFKQYKVEGEGIKQEIQ